MSNFIKSLIAVAVVMNCWIGLAGPSQAQETSVVSINPPIVQRNRADLRDNFTFFVTAEPVPTKSFTVNLEISHDGVAVHTFTAEFLAGDGEIQVDIPANQLGIPRFPENHSDDEVSIIAVRPGTGYVPSEASGTATVTVTAPPPFEHAAWMTFIKRIVDQSDADITNRPPGDTPNFRFTVSGDTNRFELRPKVVGTKPPLPSGTLIVPHNMLGQKTHSFYLYESSATFREVLDPTSGFRLEPDGVRCVNGRNQQTISPTVNAQGEFTINGIKRGDEFDCTITNTYVPPKDPPTLIIIKKIDSGSTGTFNFEVTGDNLNTTLTPPPLKITASDKGFKRTDPALDVATGPITIREIVPDGYRFKSAECLHDGQPRPKQSTADQNAQNQSVTVTIPETGAEKNSIVCTFVNEVAPPPKLIIKKIVKAPNSETPFAERTFKFSLTGLESDSQPIRVTERNQAVAGPEISLENVTGFAVAEVLQDGYRLDAQDDRFGCRVDDQKETIGEYDGTSGFAFGTADLNDLPQSAQIICTFVNVPPPTLVIEKIVKTAERQTVTLPQTFGFAFSEQDIQMRNIPVGQANVISETLSIDVKSGGLTITEVLPENSDLRLQSAQCRTVGEDGKFDTKDDIELGDANTEALLLTLNVPATGEVRCRFINVPVDTPDPPILIVKKIVKGDGNGIFSFTFNPESGLNLKDIPITTEKRENQTPELTVAAGDITITEIHTSAFTFNNAFCEVGGKRLVSSAKPRITVNVPETGTVTCTFVNDTVVAPPPPPPEVIYADVIIKKVTRGGVGTFSFITAKDSFSASRSITTVADSDARGKAATGNGKTGKISVPTGTVTITEEKHKSFKFVSATCEGVQSKEDSTKRNVEFTLVEGATVTCTFVNREVAGTTISIISNFLYRRAQQLLGDTGRPRLIERRQNIVRGGSLKDAIGVTGAGSLKDGSVGFRTSLRGALGDRSSAKAERFGIRPSDYGIQTRTQKHRTGWDVWTEGRINYYRSDATYDGSTTSGHFGVVRIGTDYLVAPRFLVGFLAQYDSIDEDNGGGPDGYRVSGKGFMIGPYAEYQLGKGLYFDAKVLWGQSTNDIAPFNTYTDSFGTTRWLAAARLTGSWDYQVTSKGVLHFSPRAEIAYFSETSESYVDSNDINIAGQAVNLGRVTVGPEVSYRHVTRAGTRIEPRLAIKGLWSFGNGDPKGLDPAFVSNVSKRKVDRFGVQFSSGILIEAPSGLRIDLQGDYTGGFGDDEERSVGGKVNITVPLQER